MTILDTLLERNERFVADGFQPDLKILPSSRILLIGCLDPRVDPMQILGLQPGEAAIIRNIGGRINPALVETLTLLPVVTRAAGQEMGPGYQLIILHHTDCGIIGCYKHAPDLLATHLGVTRDELDGMSVTDPYQAVQMDIAAYQAETAIPGSFTVSGLVYNVANGRVEVVVAPRLLRPE